MAEPDIVRAGGLGVSTGSADPEAPLSQNAPVVHLRGYSYKGTVEVTGRPRGRLRQPAGTVR